MFIFVKKKIVSYRRDLFSRRSVNIRKFADILHNTPQTQETNINSLSWIRTRHPNNQAAYAAPQAGRSLVRSGHTVVLGLTQPLAEMSTKDISWGKGGR